MSKGKFMATKVSITATNRITGRKFMNCKLASVKRPSARRSVRSKGHTWTKYNSSR